MSAYNQFLVAKFSNGQLSLDRQPYQYRPSSKDRTHIIVEGERLDTIAFKYYDNSTLWYILADVNGIINPFDLTIGDEILIPEIS